MKSTPLITTCQFGQSYIAEIQWREIYLTPAPGMTVQSYTTRRDAIRGAVRALRRIGYRGEYQVSLI